MSLWWSFTLTAFGAAGIFLTYRSYTAYLGPAIGISIQLVWVAYAIASQQWWFIVSALLYGGSHLYGIRKRRRERDEAALSAAQDPNDGVISMARKCCFHGDNECSVLTRHCPAQQTEFVDWGSSTEIKDNTDDKCFIAIGVTTIASMALGLALVIVKLASGGGFCG